MLAFLDLTLNWIKYKNFRIAYLSEEDKQATGYTALVKVTATEEFWGKHIEDYLDALCEKNCVGPVLFDIRGTKREVPDDFVELYIKYRQFCVKHIRVYTAYTLQPIIRYFDTACTKDEAYLRICSGIGKHME